MKQELIIAVFVQLIGEFFKIIKEKYGGYKNIKTDMRLIKKAANYLQKALNVSYIRINGINEWLESQHVINEFPVFIAKDFKLKLTGNEDLSIKLEEVMTSINNYLSMPELTKDNLYLWQHGSFPGFKSQLKVSVIDCKLVSVTIIYCLKALNGYYKKKILGEIIDQRGLKRYGGYV
jgi:hypothetical protein